MAFNFKGRTAVLQGPSRAGNILCTLLVVFCIFCTVLVSVVFWGPDSNVLDRQALELEVKQQYGWGTLARRYLSLAWRILLLGNDHPDVARGLKHIAGYYELTGRHQECIEPLLSRALAIQRTAYQQPSVFSMHRMLNCWELLATTQQLTDLYIKEGKYAQAVRLIPEQIDLLKTGAQRYELARRFIDQFDELAKQKVVSWKNVSFQIQSRIWQWNFEGHVSALVPVGRLKAGQLEKWIVDDLIDLKLEQATENIILGRYEAAENDLEQALTLKQERREGEDITLELVRLAEVSRIQGRFRKAEALYRRALARRRTSVLRERLTLLLTLQGYARLLADMGRGDEQGRVTRQCEKILDSLRQEETRRTEKAGAPG